MQWEKANIYPTLPGRKGAPESCRDALRTAALGFGALGVGRAAVAAGEHDQMQTKGRAASC